MWRKVLAKYGTDGFIIIDHADGLSPINFHVVNIYTSISGLTAIWIFLYKNNMLPKLIKVGPALA